jgi:hypothetical protein
MRKILASLLPPLSRDAIGLAGAGAIAYGAWLIYVPAGFIVGGVMAVAVALISAGKSDQGAAS